MPSTSVQITSRCVGVFVPNKFNMIFPGGCCELNMCCLCKLKLLVSRNGGLSPVNAMHCEHETKMISLPPLLNSNWIAVFNIFKHLWMFLRYTWRVLVGWLFVRMLPGIYSNSICAGNQLSKRNMYVLLLFAWDYFWQDHVVLFWIHHGGVVVHHTWRIGMPSLQRGSARRSS